ncbi:MAG TPA: ribonucleotide reductase N-terminal alpha domain-containing protein [Ktedonobacteraceae bacterium]|nr:ribonucleotide reductase N-terminal alpha domain-containing protein [Ktedonobacteraceae bacterium]
MLEQQERPSSQDADSTMTQLEGIRQKVFMDRYSLKDAAGQPLEFYPEQTWARVARGIAAVETSEEKRAEWEKRFYDALSDFQFVPGGRILAGAGTGHQVTYYNCMPPDQEVLTANGYRPISQVAVGDLVVTHRNRLRPVLHRFERETSEPLYIIRPKKIGYDELRLTGDHKVYIIRSEWVNKHKSRDGLRLQHEPDWIPAKDIKPGDYVTFVCYDEDPPRVEMPEHNTDLKYYFEHDNLRWVQIDEIAVKEYAGMVMDIEVEEDHSFISAGVVVSNCFVIPSPEDSRQGILDNLKLMTEIMARGGGVGINLSTLRPRGSYIKTVNGTASGPCSWAQLYSVATGDVIQQGGSRRGALMLMLDDNHPDIEEFITVKRTPGKIEHANLSVCVSDAFMQAVKNDADWNLTWQGEVKRTVRARALWDLICTSAWESAEPGVVFIDRYNKESNTWYYENIRCVNPCVTGDTLVSTEHGYTYARDLQIGMKVRTPAGLKPIEKLYNNGLQRIYRVNFSDGGYLEGTADHKLKVVRGKKYQWVPISELTEGDKVLVVANEAFGPRQNLPAAALEYIAKRELKVADFYDRKLGLIIGAMLGDGTLRELQNGNSHAYQYKITFGAHEDGWYDTFVNLMTDMNIHTHRTLDEKEFARAGGVAVKHASVRLECYKLASLLMRIGMIPNAKAPQKAIPAAFMAMEKEFLAGILDGLFSTDGSILMKQDNPMLRFHTSSYELAQQVRLILLQFGIHGRVYRAAREEDLMYDGRSMYGTGEKYDVVIMNEGIPRFYAEIGLSHPEKAARLKEIAESWHYFGGSWLASVVSVEDTEREEEVYDLYEPETLTWITNGYCSLDCGEQGLPPFGVCNLGALNLAAFVKNGEMDWERLAEKSKVAMRFLDNVVDANEYFIEENETAQLGTRRTGLGTMGLADALIKMKIAYGSEESLPIIERIYATIRDAAYEASADIADEKGSFPHFDRDKYMQGKFIKRLPKHVQEKIRQQGIRNAVLLTQAPTGTTSLLAGVSSGIEPVYDFAMIRRDRTGEHILYHPLLQEWRDKHTNAPTPAYFVSSKDLTPEEHVRVQAMVQRYTDSSISKTVNAPNEHTVEQVETLYRLAYEMGCKGVTYYRDGSRDAVLTRVEDEKKAAQQQAQETPVMQTVVSVQHGIKPRPPVVQGYTRQISAPEGKINVTINSDDQGPLEVFVNVGKAGSDIAALAEALGRLISLNLRVLSPLSQTDRLQEIAENLRGIGGSRSIGFGMQQVRSMPDAVARALELHLESLQPAEDNPAEVNNHSNGHDDPPAHNDLSRLSVTGNLCPQCGCNTMVYEEGCRKCYTCGHSEC